MKKTLYILLIILTICTGCVKENKNEKGLKTQKEIIKEKNVKEEKNSYKDLNNTPIGIYKLSGNKLIKLHTINTKLEVEGIIDTFQIFPSNEEEITLNNTFATSFYNEWTNFKNINNNLKIGFNIKFKLKNGENISYNIYSPVNTFDKWEYLMNYLYDDYANQNKSFYSHIESNKMNDNTLFTAFKMQMSYSCFNIDSKIQFSVFTYDGNDDFKDNEYRGNSIYTINICIDGISCN